MDREQLDSLNVLTLRDIARRMGVMVPTTKRKAELITEILEIEAGTREPYLPAVKQGRPPKGTGYAYVGTFDPGLPSAYPEFSTKLSFSQNTQEFNYDEIVTVLGYVEIQKDNTAFLWSVADDRFKTYFIPFEILKDNYLHFGDCLMASVGYENRNPVIKSVLTVNGAPVQRHIKDHERKNYYDITHEDSAEVIDFSDERFTEMNIGVADNVFLSGKNNRGNTEFVIDMLNSAQVDKKFYINCSVIEKDRPTLKRIKGAGVFVADLIENNAVTERMLSVALQSALRAFETGKQVLIVIDGLDALSCVSSGQSSYGKHFLAIPKNNKKYGSITVVSVLPSNFETFTRLADKCFTLEDGKAILK